MKNYITQAEQALFAFQVSRARTQSRRGGSRLGRIHDEQPALTMSHIVVTRTL